MGKPKVQVKKDPQHTVAAASVAKKKKATVATKKKKAPKPKGGGANVMHRDPLSIPKDVRRRFFKRSKCERIGGGALDPMDGISRDQVRTIMNHAVRLATLDNVSTIKQRHVQKALNIEGIKIY